MGNYSLWIQIMPTPVPLSATRSTTPDKLAPATIEAEIPKPTTNRPRIVHSTRKGSDSFECSLTNPPFHSP